MSFDVEMSNKFTKFQNNIIRINYYPNKDKLVRVDSFLNVINENIICLESIDTIPLTQSQNGFGTTLLHFIFKKCKDL